MNRTAFYKYIEAGTAPVCQNTPCSAGGMTGLAHIVDTNPSTHIHTHICCQIKHGHPCTRTAHNTRSLYVHPNTRAGFNDRSGALYAERCKCLSAAKHTKSHLKCKAHKSPAQLLHNKLKSGFQTIWESLNLPFISRGISKTTYMPIVTPIGLDQENTRKRYWARVGQKQKTMWVEFKKKKEFQTETLLWLL